ncbi:MAG: NAD(P)(+) transhydrogenase (Re/Si-specific) subunit beta [bacterium]
MELTPQTIREIGYLISALLFILGIKLISNPKTAIRGNIVSLVGMVIAILSTFLNPTAKLSNLWFIMLAIIAGTYVGIVASNRVKFTEMPQMVSLFNGMGGLTISFIAVIEFLSKAGYDKWFIVSAGFSGMIGAISFVGSMLAMLKLWGILDKPIRSKLLTTLNLALLMTLLVVYVLLVMFPSPYSLIILFVLGGVIGFSGVLPIGGADMPVVISILNTFTGLAASIAGFAINNNAMIVAGTLVGASGTILTILMAKAMNRSIVSIVVGGFGIPQSTQTKKASVQQISIEDAAILLSYSKKVIIVPGYGMAVSGAQNELHELEQLLESKGVEVKYAIHPVAGRMPGHMNVLLAEANVEYSKLYEMEEINPEFKNTDVVLVVGANDIVNPAAKNNPNSPLYGMPILEVDQAQNIIFMKRSLNPGFAGVDNELFFNPKTKMLFGDAKQTLKQLISSVKSL